MVKSFPVPSSFSSLLNFFLRLNHKTAPATAQTGAVDQTVPAAALASGQPQLGVAAPLSHGEVASPKQAAVRQPKHEVGRLVRSLGLVSLIAIMAVSTSLSHAAVVIGTGTNSAASTANTASDANDSSAVDSGDSALGISHDAISVSKNFDVLLNDVSSTMDTDVALDQVIEEQQQESQNQNNPKQHQASTSAHKVTNTHSNSATNSGERASGKMAGHGSSAGGSGTGSSGSAGGAATAGSSARGSTSVGGASAHAGSTSHAGATSHASSTSHAGFTNSGSPDGSISSSSLSNGIDLGISADLVGLGGLNTASTRKAPVPTKEELTRRLKEIAADTSLSATDKQKATRVVNHALSLWDDYERVQQERKTIDDELSQAATLLVKLEQALAQANQAYTKNPPPITSENIDTVNTLISALSTSLTQVQAQLNDAMAAYNSLQTLPTRAQQQIANNTDQISEINKKINDPTIHLLPDEQIALPFESYVREQQNALLQTELKSLNVFQDIANYKIRIHSLHKDYLSSYLTLARTRHNSLLSTQIASAQIVSSQLATAPSAGGASPSNVLGDNSSREVTGNTSSSISSTGTGSTSSSSSMTSTGISASGTATVSSSSASSARGASSGTTKSQMAASAAAGGTAAGGTAAGSVVGTGSAIADRQGQAAGRTISELSDVVQQNTELAQAINRMLEDNATMTRELQEVTVALTSIQQVDKSIQEQLSDLSGSVILSRLLNRQLGALPHISISFNLDELIPNLNLRMYELSSYREQIFDIQSYVDALILRNSSYSPYREQLVQLTRQRRNLSDELYNAMSDGLTIAIELRTKYNDLTKTVHTVTSTINEHLFWLTSNPGLSFDFIVSFMPNLMMQFNNFVSNATLKITREKQVINYLKIILPLLLAGLLTYKARPYLMRKVNELALRLDKTTDGYMVTPLALFCHAFLIVPKVVVIALLGSLVIFWTVDQYEHQRIVTYLLALHLMAFLYVRHIMEPNSLIQRHFSAIPETVAKNRHIVDQLWFVSVPMLLIANILEVEPSKISGDIVGYVLMQLGFLYLTCFAVATVRRHFLAASTSLAFWLIAIVGVLTPLTIAFMLGLGYYYTVIQLLNRVAITLYIGFAYVILSQTLRRELYVAEIKIMRVLLERQLLPGAAGNGANSASATRVNNARFQAGAGAANGNNAANSGNAAKRATAWGNNTVANGSARSENPSSARETSSSNAWSGYAINQSVSAGSARSSGAWGNKDALGTPNIVLRERRGENLRLELVNNRAFKLFNAVLLTVFVYFMYLQWNDLAGVLTYLNKIYLWEEITIVNGQPITNALSLGDVLLAAVIIIVAWVLERNLPMLIERLFMLRQGMGAKSASYTIKLITSYLISALGIVLAAGALGVRWENLQWLVAALSVGLGFGLQDIFANFVSGLIILFERQIRVGDIVTISGLSGTVSKIRIRASTILSFEYKEVVIPNRQFITSALTNWSLSNTVTMIEFVVGVSYDSDTAKAKELLRGIIRRCRDISRVKKPLIYIKNLDASDVVIMCEVYVSEIAKRKLVYDYLSSETLRVFKENNIEMPFNQLEVTIRNTENNATLSYHPQDVATMSPVNPSNLPPGGGEAAAASAAPAAMAAPAASANTAAPAAMAASAANPSPVATTATAATAATAAIAASAIPVATADTSTSAASVASNQGIGAVTGATIGATIGVGDVNASYSSGYNAGFNAGLIFAQQGATVAALGLGNNTPNHAGTITVPGAPVAHNDVGAQASLAATNDAVITNATAVTNGTIATNGVAVTNATAVANGTIATNGAAVTNATAVANSSVAARGALSSANMSASMSASALMDNPILPEVAPGPADLIAPELNEPAANNKPASAQGSKVAPRPRMHVFTVPAAPRSK